MKISKTTAVLFGVLGLAAGTAGAIAFQTQAAGTTSTAATTTSGFRQGTPPAAAGTVTAVSASDNTITVTDKRSGTSYTVDTSNANIQKFTPPASGTTPTTKPTPATISVSGIAVGDNVTVQGTVSGTGITATKITDGMMMGRGGFGGHGQQRAMGTVSAVNGNTITLTGKNGKTYTIDAASATIKKVSDSTVGSITVGDQLMVNGTTSGSTVTATNIVDGVMGFGHGQPPTTTSPPAN